MMKKNKFLETYGIVDKYYFDKRIFRLTFFLLFIIMIIALGANDFNFKPAFYVNCPVEEPYCNNPFYGVSIEDCPVPGLCDVETLKGGEAWGNLPKTDWFNWYLTLTLLLIFSSLVINHIAHNTKILRYKKK